MTVDHMLEYLAEEEVLAVVREALQDSVALVPSNIDLIRTDKFCEEWSVATQIGVVPLVFYFNGIVTINTAPYNADTLTWISDKAKLMKLTSDKR